MMRRMGMAAAFLLPLSPFLVLFWNFYGLQAADLRPQLTLGTVMVLTVLVAAVPTALIALIAHRNKEN